jgi:hypothetical protein
MPLPGGPSDKAGNSYERRWTVFSLVDLLDGRAERLRIEVPGDDGAGSEFCVMVNGVPEWHQAKRQRAAGPWTVSALVSEGVVQPWLANLTRGDRCVFVSSTGADELRELADRARSARSFDEFATKFLTAEPVRKRFARLRRAWNDPPEADARDALIRIQVRAIGENELAEWINHRLRSLTAGTEPATVAAVLAQLADDSAHQEISASDVWRHLAKHRVTPRDLDRDAALVRRVADTADSYLDRLRPLYIGGHELSRREANIAVSHLDDGRRVVLAGGAGAGKSVVTAQVVKLARERGWPVFVLSAERLPDTATTTQLGVELELPDSPASVLAGVAAGGAALLVVDQLDAVSVASGRHPERLALVADLLREARSYPGLRVLLACRQFDIDNDRSLRVLAHDDNAAVVPIGNLDEEQIRQAISAAGLTVEAPVPLLQLLAVPLHLALYVDLALAGVEDVHSVRTLTQLYDRYWTTKRTACRLVRDGSDDWLPVIERLVQWMSDRQELAVPEAVLDDLDQQVKVMASEGVLAVGDVDVSFFHETFFDYCFARQFLASGATVRDLLTTSEQDLFRRAQVRQLLTYQRGADFTAYLADFSWLTNSPEVRLHIKALVISLLEIPPNPAREEWQALRPIAEDPQSPLHLRLWQAIRRNAAWFPILDAAGTWAAMLRAGGDTADRAVWALSGCAADHAARVSALLADTPPELWASRRSWFLRLVEVHRARELVDLLLAAVDAGDFDASDGDLTYILRRLAAPQPTWAAEVLAALVRRKAAAEPAANPFHPEGRLRAHSRELGSEVRTIATTAPAEYVDQLLHQLLDLMRANERPEWSGTEFVHDALWSHRIYPTQWSLSDVIFDGMGHALAALAEADPARAESVFSLLRTETYEAAAFLLARGYAGNPAVFVDDAADWLAATPGARLLGYADSPAWISRQLVAAISPHCSPDHFDQLVDALLYYAPPNERTYKGLRSRGIAELCLLDGIDPGRRPSRVERRLAELRRKFGIDDVSPPAGLTGGVVPPPIPEERARRMSDRQWLGAMRRYGPSGTSWRDGRLIGDAWTQAQVLETLTKEDPQRFARLLLAIPPGDAEAYVSAILRGLAGARLDRDLLLSVCRQVRNLAGSDANRWLVRLIETHAAGTVDDELVETVAKIAVSDRDPAERAPGEPWNGGSVDSAALNSTRGAAALALGQLLFEEPARRPIIERALRRLAADPQPEVRVAATGALAPLLNIDPDLALTLFHEAVDQAPEELLGSQHVAHFLNYAIRQRHYLDIASLLQRMLTDPEDATRQAAARRLALASFYTPDIDDRVDTVLNGGDEAARAAAVGVFADSVTYAPRRERSITVVSAAFHDSAKAVRDAAERAFYDLGDERLGDYAPMIAAFANSPAFADGAGAVLHTLERSRQPLPPGILDLCETFVRIHKDAIGDISTSAAGDAMHIVSLALRMRAQHVDPAMRRRCLDLIDQLVALRAHEIESALDKIER